VRATRVFVSMPRRRVLIVEDDPLVAMDVEAALTAAHYQVCGSASTAAAALFLAESTKPDFAVVDVKLAHGDGRQVARALIDRYNTTVLMATGEWNDPSLFFHSGAKACLKKPFDAARVARALEIAEALQAGNNPGRVEGGLMTCE